MILDRKKAPAFNQVEKIEFLDVKTSQLDNGIPLNIINGGSQEILKIDFIFKAGIYAQHKPLLASSTSKLLKEGTIKYTAYEIAEGIDNYGAFLEVGHSFDTANVSLYTLTKHLDKVLPYVQEVILNPTFSQHEIDIYLKNAKEKFRVNLEKVSYVARQEFSSLLYGQQDGYANKVTIENFDQLSRNDLITFHKEFYNLSNASIIVSGLVNDKTISAINDCFGNEKLSQIPNRPTKTNEGTEQEQIHITKEKALQSAIRIGRTIPNRLNDDFFGLKVLNTILGGYFGSRLMSNIREDKGYTYGIGSGLVSMANSSYFFISTEVQGDVTNVALDEIYKEIERIQTELIHEEELSLVKNYMLGQLLNTCDGPFKMAAMYEEIELYGLDLEYYNNYIEVIKKISPKELRSLGEKYFNRNDLKEVVVGKI